MSRCPNSWRGQHKFEPRYDEKMPEGMTEVSAIGFGVINRLKDKKYVRDVCVRCGETIERSKP